MIANRVCETTFSIDGKTYTVKSGFRTAAAIEAALGMPMAFVAREALKLGLSTITTILKCALNTAGHDVPYDVVGEAVTEKFRRGEDDLTTAALDIVNLYFPPSAQLEEAGDSVKKPKKPKIG